MVSFRNDNDLPLFASQLHDILKKTASFKVNFQHKRIQNKVSFIDIIANEAIKVFKDSSQWHCDLKRDCGHSK